MRKDIPPRRVATRTLWRGGPCSAMRDLTEQGRLLMRYRLSLLLALAIIAIVGHLVGGLVRDPAHAQAPPPLPPHQFYGTSPTLDDVPLPNGTIIRALSETNMEVGTAIVTDAFWAVEIASAAAENVRFTVTGALSSDTFLVIAGELTEVDLDLRTEASGSPENGMMGGDPDPPTVLPNGGTGGIFSHSGGGRAVQQGVLLAVAAVGFAALAAAAVRLTTRR